jgi:Vanillate O-demethylase oxygenase C-terminal domain
VVHRRDFRRTRREAAGAGDLQRNLHGKIDRWQFLEFRPPIYARSTLGAREAGSDLPFGTPTHVVLNSFTPETERTTHYFWSTVRSWGLDDAKVSKTYKDMTDLAFAEDARMVELQQQLIDSDPSGTPLVSLAFDRARSRRAPNHQAQAGRGVAGGRAGQASETRGDPRCGRHCMIAMAAGTVAAEVSNLRPCRVPFPSTPA